MSRKKSIKIGTIFYEYIKNNKRGYWIVTILFFVGLTIGIFAVNHASDTMLNEMHTYYTDLTAQAKEIKNIDYFDLLKQSIFSNLKLIFLLWFSASTIVGIPVVYGTVVLKGFSIGYTITSMLKCMGIGRGMGLAVSSMLLHHILLIPAILGASVSGRKVYQSIMRNKNKENIKVEMIRHTLFCTVMFLVTVLSSILEVYGSTNLFFFLLKK